MADASENHHITFHFISSLLPQFLAFQANTEMQPKNVKKHQKREKPAHRRCDAPKEKSPTEVTIEKEDPSVYLDCWPSCLLVRVGSHLIDTTFTSDQPRAATWITETLLQQRHLRRRGGPLLVGLCAFRGVSSSDRSYGYRTNSNYPSNPYHAISICLGGSHVLIYRHQYYDYTGFSIKPLERLVEDKNVVVVGVGVKEIAKKLQDQWGLLIKRPVDLRLLMAGAYGKDTVWWPKHEKGRVVIDNLGLEEMARIALEDIRLEKKPARVLEANWSGSYYYCFPPEEEEEEMELTKYAARDAFISYEIAAKCIGKTGLPSEAPPVED